MSREGGEGRPTHTMVSTFTIDEARALIPEIRARTAEVVERRRAYVEARDGAPAERKAAEAALGEALEWFVEQGVEVKGFAPMLLDFHSELDGEPVLLCWLEGEDELGWYHRLEHGFMGRRPLP